MGALIGISANRRSASENEITHEEKAECTAWVWLALYSIAIAGSLLLGPEHRNTRRRLLARRLL